MNRELFSKAEEEKDEKRQRQRQLPPPPPTGSNTLNTWNTKASWKNVRAIPAAVVDIGSTTWAGTTKCRDRRRLLATERDRQTRKTRLEVEKERPNRAPSAAADDDGAEWCPYLRRAVWDRTGPCCARRACGWRAAPSGSTDVGRRPASPARTEPPPDRHLIDNKMSHTLHIRGGPLFSGPRRVSQLQSTGLALDQCNHVVWPGPSSNSEHPFIK